MENKICLVCDTPLKLKYKLKYNVFECSACKLQSSDASFDHSFVSELDPESRETGLQDLRQKNFEVIIDTLKDILAGEGKKGLEVGVGSGWWLEICQKHKIDCIGIEPERSFQELHSKGQLKVFYGFYPDEQVSDKEGYDFIIFNDVFEHIPDLHALIEALRKDLKDDGSLIINIPMSSGFFYRVASFLSLFGIRAYLERMWQFNFHSPHMNYFNERNLIRLLKRFNFTNTKVFKLDSLDFKHLKERVTYDKTVGKFKGFLIISALSMLKPFINAFNPDIKVLVFKKDV